MELSQFFTNKFTNSNDIKMKTNLYYLSIIVVLKMKFKWCMKFSTLVERPW